VSAVITRLYRLADSCLLGHHHTLTAVVEFSISISMKQRKAAHMLSLIQTE